MVELGAYLLYLFLSTCTPTIRFDPSCFCASSPCHGFFCFPSFEFTTLSPAYFRGCGNSVHRCLSVHCGYLHADGRAVSAPLFNLHSRRIRGSG
ncbi:hypothetical protein F4678DRAFT_160961 [Xylaria arbuscula]|nr:hypothetical protein F4678DRAFT_160961 [Xylaria arbuscula]